MHLLRIALTAVIASGALAASPALADGKKKSKGAREKYLHGEAHWGGDKTKVDFDAVDINGAPKTPAGEMVQISKADKNYDFVRIRTNWHAESVQSAATLDASTAAR